MRKVAENETNHRAAPHHIVQSLADWWTRPDTDRTTLWCSAAFQERVVSAWREVVSNGLAESVKRMLFAATVDQTDLATEYERLFVGPAAIPCPPYESVWRKDRPKHEQGTIMGQSTTEAVQLYRELELRLRPDQAELADHVAIELEALAFAWASRADAELAHKLLERLRFWIPDFCASVIDNSRLEFYRVLARITEQCFAVSSSLTSAGTLPEKTQWGQNNRFEHRNIADQERVK